MSVDQQGLLHERAKFLTFEHEDLGAVRRFWDTKKGDRLWGSGALIRERAHDHMPMFFCRAHVLGERGVQVHTALANRH